MTVTEYFLIEAKSLSSGSDKGWTVPVFGSIAVLVSNSIKWFNGRWIPVCEHFLLNNIVTLVAVHNNQLWADLETTWNKPLRSSSE